jgi:hypothetical protein
VSGANFVNQAMLQTNGLTGSHRPVDGNLYLVRETKSSQGTAMICAAGSARKSTAATPQIDADSAD